MPCAMKEIARFQEFTLFDRPEKASGEWRSLKLVKTGEGPKRNWWLGWNGERLAGGRDQRLLAEHNPDVEQHVVAVLENHAFD